MHARRTEMSMGGWCFSSLWISGVQSGHAFVCIRVFVRATENGVNDVSRSRREEGGGAINRHRLLFRKTYHRQKTTSKDNVERQPPSRVVNHSRPEALKTTANKRKCITLLYNAVVRPESTHGPSLLPFLFGVLLYSVLRLAHSRKISTTVVVKRSRVLFAITPHTNA